MAAACDDKPDRKLHKIWKKVARELSQEQDSQRIAQLTDELNQAMLEEERSKVRVKLRGTA